MAALCDKGLGKFAHADGAVVLLKDLVNTDLDLLAHLPHQLRLLHHFYHIYFLNIFEIPQNILNYTT